MRTKDEILEEAERNIQTRKTGGDAELWLEFRKIEVLCNIRDIFSQTLVALGRIGDNLE